MNYLWYFRYLDFFYYPEHRLTQLLIKKPMSHWWVDLLQKGMWKWFECLALNLVEIPIIPIFRYYSNIFFALFVSDSLIVIRQGKLTSRFYKTIVQTSERNPDTNNYKECFCSPASKKKGNEEDQSQRFNLNTISGNWRLVIDRMEDSTGNSNSQLPDVMW